MDIKNKQKSDFNSDPRNNKFPSSTQYIVSCYKNVIKDFCSPFSNKLHNDNAPHWQEKQLSGRTMRSSN